MEPSARLTSSVTSMAPPGAANPGIGATSWAASTIALASSPSPPAGNCVGRAGSKPGCGPAPGAAWSAHETCGKPAAPWPLWPPWPNGGPPDGSDGGGPYDCPGPAPYGWPPAGLNGCPPAGLNGCPPAGLNGCPPAGLNGWPPAALNGWPYCGPPAAPYPPNAWPSA